MASRRATCRTISAGDGPWSGRSSQVPRKPGSWPLYNRSQQPTRGEPLEIADHVLAAVVVADRETAGDVLREAAEVPPHPLAERLEGVEAVRVEGSVDADAPGRAVVDGDEHGRLALAGDRGGQVGAPHRV